MHLPPGQHAPGGVALQAALVVTDPHVAVQARHNGVDVARVCDAAVRGHLLGGSVDGRARRQLRVRFSKRPNDPVVVSMWSGSS